MMRRCGIYAVSVVLLMTLLFSLSSSIPMDATDSSPGTLDSVVGAVARSQPARSKTSSVLDPVHENELLQHPSLNAFGSHYLPQLPQFLSSEGNFPARTRYFGEQSSQSVGGAHDADIPTPPSTMSPHNAHWENVVQAVRLNTVGQSRQSLDTWNRDPYTAHRISNPFAVDHSLSVPYPPPNHNSYLGLLQAVESSAELSHHLYPQARTGPTSSTNRGLSVLDLPPKPLPNSGKQLKYLPDAMVLDSLNIPADSESGPGKRKSDRGIIAASKFLEHHPQLRLYTEPPVAVREMSPEAQLLKSGINEHLFNNKLEWRTKGDQVAQHSDKEGRFRQYLNRMQARHSWFVAEPQAPWSPKSLLVVPHRSYAQGSVMFDPETGTKNLLFSFWTPSADTLYPRLQLVGSASLTVQDATELLRQFEAPLNVLGPTASSAAPRLPRVAPLRRKSPIISSGLFVASRTWLSELPAFELLPQDSPARLKLSKNLVPGLHDDAQRIKESANKAFFGDTVVWQSSAETAMMQAKTESGVGIFRYHMRSKLLYLGKPEALQVLPYQLVLIPYEIQGSRAKLFDASLGGVALTFTLWAAHASPGERFSDSFLFVSGASVRIRDSAAAIQKAKTRMGQLMGAGIHLA